MSKLRLDEAKYITKQRAPLTTGQLIKIPSSAFLSHGFFCLQWVSFLLCLLIRSLTPSYFLPFFLKKKIGKYNRFGLPWSLSGKESSCQCRRCGFHPWVRKIPWRRKWQPTPVFLPGESHRQRSLVGYSPWGRKWVGYDLAIKQQIITALQCFVSFCCKTKWISNMCTYIPSRWDLLPFPPSHPSRSSRRQNELPVWHSSFPLCVLHTVGYICQFQPPSSSHPPPISTFFLTLSIVDWKTLFSRTVILTVWLMERNSGVPKTFTGNPCQNSYNK